MTAAALSLAPRALPRQVKPFPGETLSSYLGRLAHANRLDPTALRRYFSEDRKVSATRLAAVSGVDAVTIQRAIADLDGRSLAPTYYYRDVSIHQQVSAPACQMCAAMRGITQRVMCWKPAEKVICLRHRRWTGSDKNTATSCLSIASSTSWRPTGGTCASSAASAGTRPRWVPRSRPRSAVSGATSASTTRSSAGCSPSSMGPTGGSHQQTRLWRPRHTRKWSG